MFNRYKQISNANQNVHFSKALFSEAEHSRMAASPEHITTFNAGCLVPIYCREVLPDESLKIDLDFVLRQTTLLTPSMGKMHVDFYAFFVPNRIVNQSWKAVEGENLNGSWTANNISLVPLKSTSEGFTQIPVGSVADYYGIPTQQPMPNSVLSLCNDFRYRGYVMIWNEWFRDQNYQPPIPLSTLNVYQGFLDPDDSDVTLGVGMQPNPTITSDTVPNGSVGDGSIANSLYGSGSIEDPDLATDINPASPINRFRATMPPLRVNKLHDYFTSGLPSPQKSSSSIFAPVTGNVNLSLAPQFVTTTAAGLTGQHLPLRFLAADGGPLGNNTNLGIINDSSTDNDSILTSGTGFTASSGVGVYPANLQTVGGSITGPIDGLALSVDDIRMASAIQQVYEILARGGSRYREIVRSFFGIESDDPYSDIPKCLGHLSRDLDLYQTAQTSASESGNTPQGNLAAFGYTSSSGALFESSFLEHGYVHIFAVVRHRNIYPSFMSRDNFRLNMLDFYLPPFANISEQPVFTREINPFAPFPNNAFCYQEAWAEYRYEPDQVSGYMRPGVDNSLAIWNYADDFDSGLQILSGDWLRSNSESVLNRTLAVTSAVSPQLKGQFKFIVDKTLPMPTYSVPGMDII